MAARGRLRGSRCGRRGGGGARARLRLKSGRISGSGAQHSRMSAATCSEQKGGISGRRSRVVTPAIICAERGWGGVSEHSAARAQQPGVRPKLTRTKLTRTKPVGWALGRHLLEVHAEEGQLLRRGGGRKGLQCQPRSAQRRHRLGAWGQRRGGQFKAWTIQNVAGWLGPSRMLLDGLDHPECCWMVWTIQYLSGWFGL